MGQVRQGPVFRAAWMLGFPPALALCQSCSGAVGTAPLQSLGKGRALASFLLPRVGIPEAGQGSFLFSVKFYMCGSLFGEGIDGSRAPHLPGCGATLQTEVPSPGVAEFGGFVSAVAPNEHQSGF